MSTYSREVTILAHFVNTRGGVETRCFETETRRDFKVARPTRDEKREFGVSQPRRDTRLYIHCFDLSEGCGVRVGSQGRMFLVGVKTEVVF